MKFEWDPEKAASNLQKHGVSFEEATEIFGSPYNIDYDSEHSTQTEDRLSVRAGL